MSSNLLLGFESGRFCKISVSLPHHVMNFELQDYFWLAANLIHLFNDALSFAPD